MFKSLKVEMLKCLNVEKLKIVIVAKIIKLFNRKGCKDLAKSAKKKQNKN